MDENDNPKEKGSQDDDKDYLFDLSQGIVLDDEYFGVSKEKYQFEPEPSAKKKSLLPAIFMGAVLIVTVTALGLFFINLY